MWDLKATAHVSHLYTTKAISVVILPTLGDLLANIAWVTRIRAIIICDHDTSRTLVVVEIDKTLVNESTCVPHTEPEERSDRHNMDETSAASQKRIYIKGNVVMSIHRV